MGWFFDFIKAYNFAPIEPNRMIDTFEFFKNRHPYLTQKDIELLLAESHMVHLKPGEIFFKEGDTDMKTGFVLRGLLRGYHKEEEKEEETTVVFITEGQPCTSYQWLLGPNPSLETFEALEPTVIMVNTLDRLEKLREHNINILRLYSHTLEEKLIGAIERIQDFTMRNPETRYLALLKSRPELPQRVSQKHLASYLGITQQSLSRIRARIVKK